MVVDFLTTNATFFGYLVLSAGMFYVLHLKMKRREHYGVGHYGDDDGPRTNCPECGARTDADRDTCDYCGEGLPDSVTV